MRRRVAFLLIAAAVGLAATGCGGEDTKTATPDTTEGTLPTQTTTTETTETSGEVEGDPAAGKEVFTGASACAGCHTLADANASGTVGPNLDQTKPSAALVVDRVTNGQAAMPSFKDSLSEEQIQDVAAYVSSVAGQ
jgi:mono/diheme cytochrome c family protein